MTYGDFFSEGNSDSWTQNIVLPFQPDFVIIRSISYWGSQEDPPDLYLIWSDITNDYLGSFVVFPNSTQSQILPYTASPFLVFGLKNNPQPSGSIGFKVMNFNQAGSGLVGSLCLNAEFIKLRR